MHEDAMSEMGGVGSNGSEGEASADADVLESTGTNTDACMDQQGSTVGSDEGQQWLHGMFCNCIVKSMVACTVHTSDCQNQNASNILSSRIVE